MAYSSPTDFTSDFCCFSQRALHGVHSPCSHRCAVRWAYAMPMCVLCMSSRSGIVFNPSTGAITDHSQIAKDIEPCFKSQLYVEVPGHRKPVLIWPNGLSNDKYLISAVSEIETHNLFIDSPFSYY